MSDHKYAYGWSGHILARDEFAEDDALEQNVISVPDHIFDRIVADYENMTLPVGVAAEQLGILSIAPVNFLAAGCGFTEGWKYFGTPFEEAEVRISGAELAFDRDAEYLAAMKSRYGLDLPPCRIMVGCAAEH
jgi:hypothetical protein